jgi:hypothetical protein
MANISLLDLPRWYPKIILRVYPLIEQIDGINERVSDIPSQNLLDFTVARIYSVAEELVY